MSGSPELGEYGDYVERKVEEIAIESAKEVIARLMPEGASYTYSQETRNENGLMLETRPIPGKKPGESFTYAYCKNQVLINWYENGAIIFSEVKADFDVVTREWKDA